MTETRGRPAVAPPAARIEERLGAAGLPALPRRCWLEIDAQALAGNLRAVRQLVPPGVEVAPVVKADGYGHGLEVSARAFASAGARRLCVATLDEAAALRASGIRLPVVVLFAVPPDEAVKWAGERLEFVAGDSGNLRGLLAAWGSTGSRRGELRLHLEVETGLGRAGFRPPDVAAAASAVAAAPGARLFGIWSHLAAGDDATVTAVQARLFERAVEGLRAGGLPVPPRHLGATAGLFAASCPTYEMVRPGLCGYGVLPEGFPVAPAARAAADALRPAMTLKARPIRLEQVSKGEPVGYGGLWRAERPSRIATLPVGYGDGWDRAYGLTAAATRSRTAEVLVRGRRVPLVGSVAMDALMVDVTDVEGVTEDDEFVLLGEQGGERITVGELARLRTTISWEVLASMAHRVPRVYHAGARISGLRTMAGERLVAAEGSG